MTIERRREGKMVGEVDGKGGIERGMGGGLRREGKMGGEMRIDG